MRREDILSLGRMDTRGTHVLVHRTGDGPKVSVFSTRKEAHEKGMSLRQQGADVNVYSAADYKQFVDPSWDESKHPRDSQGKFA
jgi:hypothetical protein